MLCLTISIMSLSAWTYAGFLASPPTSQAQLTGKAQPPDSGESTPHQPSPLDVLNKSRQSADRGNQVKPSPSPSDPPLVVPLYRFADQTGQIWEHSDPNWLLEFVQLRNQSLSHQPH